ncbi:iron ABC transporter permease, partial [Streptococcus gordonii]
LLYLTLLLFLIIFLLFSLFLSVSLGAVKINLLDTYRIVFSKLGWFSDIGNLSKSSIAIVWNMRVPRVLLAIIAGSGLSICGCVMQSTV